MPPKTKTSHAPTTSATRRTRSQVAPDWTHTQTLILVNEIAAVESDCLDALSYYQKWKIIADNCAALDVNRTLDQCRRKWDSLFADYNAIKSCEAESLSYWGLGRERRREMGLPEEFERELFDAVDDVVKVQVERAGLQRVSVVEDADADPLGVISPPVLIKHSHLLTPQKRQIETKQEKKVVAEKKTDSMVFIASQLEVNAGTMEVVATKPAKKAGTVEIVVTKPSKKAGTVEIMVTQAREKADSTEVLCAQLREKAEMVQAILEGKLGESKDYTLSDMRNGPDSCTNLARRQCDKLIDCFSVIANTLDQLCKAAPQKMS